MLQPQPRIQKRQTLEVPPHFETFAQTSLEVLQQAHYGILEAPFDSVKVMSDREADRVFIEQKLPEAMYDYELIAIHLGHTTLSVCMSHRHDHQALTGYRQSTLLLENGEATAFHTDSARIRPSEVVTNNEEAGQVMTDRLFHALGSLGVTTAPYELELPRAS